MSLHHLHPLPDNTEGPLSVQRSLADESLQDPIRAVLALTDPTFLTERPDLGQARTVSLQVQRDSQALPAQLISQVITIHEALTRHVARELHDALSQEFAAVGMEIDLLAGRPPQSRADLRERLLSVGQKIAQLAEACHRVSYRLHPSVLDDLGLEVALQEECRVFEDRHGLEVAFCSTELSENLPAEVALCLYRIAQESLRNIARHAGPTKVWVSLQADDAQVVLMVRDQGKGFDAQSRKTGLGLVSMEERVRLIHGSLSIRSQPGKGTCVEAIAPLVRNQ